jgi:F420-dependent oxidoreductase-like protein
MRIGVHFINFGLPGGPATLPHVLSATARTAEEVGCAWFTVMDHWFQMEQFIPADEPMLEGYTTLGFLAAQTERIQLGLLATGVTYRHPGLLAKIVTTLDVISGGRALFGVGAAWYEREHLGLGVPFPPVAERFERLEEALQICRQMWSPNNGPYTGTHFQLAETLCVPAPIQSPHPPIVIGGGGERKTLKLVARYGDACNLFMTSPGEVGRKLGVLAQHCEVEGRDPAGITKTILGGDPVTDPDGFVEAMKEYAKLGVQHVQVTPYGPDPVGYVRELGKIVPRLAEIG